MNIKQGSMILLVASMISISILASEEVSVVDQPVNVDEQVVTKDVKDAIVQVAAANAASPSTIDQIRELISEWSTWAWKEGIQEHPYISAGCGLSAVLLVYLLTSKVYRDAVIQENNNDERNKPKSCCRKKRQEAEAAVETTTATEALAPTLQEETSKPATEATLAPEAATETVAVASVETTDVERVLTSKEVCEEHGCACLVNGRCLCEKDERGSCSCCHKKMKELRECKQSRSRWQEEATEIFLKKILVAMREYKAAINWA